MKKVITALLLTGLTFNTSCVLALPEDMSGYFGGGYEWNRMKDKALKTNSYSTGNIFVGGRGYNLGAEVGYNFGSKAHTVLIAPVQTSFTVPIFGGIQSKTVTQTIKAKFSAGGYIDLQGYFPLDEELELMGSIGLGRMRASLSKTVNTINGYTGRPGVIISNSVINGLYVPGNSATSTSTNSHNNKSVLRLGAGAQYLFSNNLGFRAIFRWKNTSKLKATIGTGGGTARHTIAPKDTISLELGAFIKF